jgi:hypothetical protein
MFYGPSTLIIVDHPINNNLRLANCQCKDQQVTIRWRLGMVTLARKVVSRSICLGCFKVVFKSSSSWIVKHSESLFSQENNSHIHPGQEKGKSSPDDQRGWSH